MVLQTKPPATREPLVVSWDKLPDDFVLPDDPVENAQHPYLAAALTDALGAADLIGPEMLIVSNFGLVATVNRRTIVKAPDWLWVSAVTSPTFEVSSDEGSKRIRRSYTPKLEGEPVGVVMEFLSDTEAGEYSTRPTFPYGKLYFYEQILQVPTYVIFDPAAAVLEVRHLQGDRYIIQAPNERGHYWIPELNLWLGVWVGERLGKTEQWLRWWNEAGELLLWSAEQAQQAQEEAQQARQAQEKAVQQLLEAARNLLATGLPMAQVAELLGLSTEQQRLLEEQQRLLEDD